MLCYVAESGGAQIKTSITEPELARGQSQAGDSWIDQGASVTPPCYVLNMSRGIDTWRRFGLLESRARLHQTYFLGGQLGMH